MTADVIIEDLQKEIADLKETIERMKVTEEFLLRDVDRLINFFGEERAANRILQNELNGKYKDMRWSWRQEQ